MNSKKFLAFTMAAAMTLSLAACGGNGGGAGSSGGSSASGSTGDTSTGGVTAGTTVKEVVDPTGAAFKIGATGPLTGDGEGITWDSTGAVSKAPKGMVIENGAYVGMD